jgi:hypothetical protein
MNFQFLTIQISACQPHNLWHACHTCASFLGPGKKRSQKKPAPTKAADKTLASTSEKFIVSTFGQSERSAQIFLGFQPVLFPCLQGAPLSRAPGARPNLESVLRGPSAEAAWSTLPKPRGQAGTEVLGCQAEHVIPEGFPRFRFGLDRRESVGCFSFAPLFFEHPRKAATVWLLSHKI